MIQSSKFLPLANDLNLANSKLIDFIENCHQQQVTDIVELINKNNHHQLLSAIFADSPYLGRILMNNCAFAKKILSEPLDVLFDEVLKDIQETVPSLTDTVLIKKMLRQAKAKVALTISFADLSGQWTVFQITERLTKFAETCVALTVSHLLRIEMTKGNLKVPARFGEIDPNDLKATADMANDTGYVVLAMGKMGGYELNYSSDIDLIVLFDNDIVQYCGRKTAQDLFIKVTQNLVKIMQDRTADGYVFRTDLRLRPDPGATAVAISMEGAEIYYQSMGLNWERAAMIKARPIAGDIQAGYDFLARIKSFIWRKHLDYAALEDIYAMKKLIHQHHGHKTIGFSGQDIKLGHGGIREIEFYAQIFQLISGGREPELRIAATCDALNALEKSQKLSPRDNKILQEAYVYYRTLEHRLQMINDDQTHSMPDNEDDLARITAFMGYEKRADFESELKGHLTNVDELFTNLLKESHQEESKEEKHLAFPLDNYSEETLTVIKAAGFADPQAIYDIIRGWLLGRYRACRTERARKLLKGFLPEILENFGKLANPDSSFRKFDEFLSRLPSGVQLFSFIKAQPWLLEFLSEIIGIAPTLSDQLAKRPLLLDAVLNHGFFDSTFSKETLRESLNNQLALAKDFQDVLDIIRKWANENKFQVGVQILRNIVDAPLSGKNLAMVADVILELTLLEVKKEFVKKHGEMRGAQFAVMALGKLGGFELTTTSDLDLVFIYETPPEIPFSDGEKPLGPNHYFARLSQQYINALTAMTAEGGLYEIDMRLRPSGNAGPVAVTLEAFENYQRDNAWTWEHLALTRNRLVVGDPDFTDKITNTINRVLSLETRDKNKLLSDTAEMREKLRKEFGSDNIWSIKHVKGGLVDIEFICQYLILHHSQDFPSLITANTLDQLKQLKEHQVLPLKKANILLEACEFMQNLQSLLRLCIGGGDNFSDPPLELVNLLCKRFEVSSLSELAQQLKSVQQKVHNIYQEIIEVPAGKIIIAPAKDE